LQRRFGSSRILKNSDLFEDERGLFNAEHRGACPGMVKGRFFGAKERPALALVLLDVDPGRSVRLVVARPAVSTWTFLEIEELAQGSTAVVSARGLARPPVSGSARPKPATSDSVVLTGYETWQRLYSWNGRTFEKAQSND
jgi:hypothetical protein